MWGAINRLGGKQQRENEPSLPVFRDKHHNIYHDKVADKHPSHVGKHVFRVEIINAREDDLQKGVQTRKILVPVVIPFQEYSLFCKMKSGKLTVPQKRKCPVHLSFK